MRLWERVRSNMKEIVRTIEINGEMVKVVNVYEVCPVGNQKSFYGKAHLLELSNGMRVLKSYDTLILVKDGKRFLKLWDDWSATTGKHIYSFCGMRKKTWDNLPCDEWCEV